MPIICDLTGTVGNGLIEALAWRSEEVQCKWLLRFQHQVGKALGIYPCGDTTPPVESGRGSAPPTPLRQLIGRHGSSTGIDAQAFSVWCQDQEKPFNLTEKYFQSPNKKSSRLSQSLLDKLQPWRLNIPALVVCTAVRRVFTTHEPLLVFTECAGTYLFCAFLSHNR